MLASVIRTQIAVVPLMVSPVQGNVGWLSEGSRWESDTAATGTGLIDRRR